MTRLIRHKRHRPGNNLLSAMLRAHDPGELSMDELVTMGLALLMVQA
jgi:cytochrome P450